MASVQLGFSLRTSTNCKTVHLLGSWDSYKGQLPLSRTEKAGGWKGTFKFTGATLKPGQRYWFYYIIDGYHVSHDPAKEHVVEPTTGRKLNILDVPSKPGGGKPSARDAARAEKRSSRHATADIPKGRALSPSKIVSPKPVHPAKAAQTLARSDYSKDPRVAELARRLAAARVADASEGETSDSEIESDGSSDVPSLTSRSSRSSNTSSPSSVSSRSSCCTCERYGITRAGDRVKLDCGGARCGYSDGSECSSESDDDYRHRTTRRQGVVVRR